MSKQFSNSGQAIMLSKRSCIFYLEHARIMQKDDRVLYFLNDGSQTEKAFGIPDKNTMFLLLGKGTSITDAAVRKLSESNVVIGFCGSGGSPLFSAMDLVFLSPQDEYRPTEYAQKWACGWMKESARLCVARHFLKHRRNITTMMWKPFSLVVPQTSLNDLDKALDTLGLSVTQLLSCEGRWAKSLYAHLAIHHGISFSRQEGRRRRDSKENLINSFLDHGNYIAYGYAAAALHCLGIPYCFPVMHGKTRRGALIFDVADLIKDGLVMPLAFKHGAATSTDQEFRHALIKASQEMDIMDKLMDIIKEGCVLMDENQ